MITKKEDNREVDRLIGSKILLASDSSSNIRKETKEKINPLILKHGYQVIFKNVYSESKFLFVLLSKLSQSKTIETFNFILNKILLRNIFIIYCTACLCLCLFFYISFNLIYNKFYSLQIITIATLVSIIVGLVADLINIVENKK